jgi:hypothetical protein
MVFLVHIFQPTGGCVYRRGQAWKFITTICQSVGLRGNFGTHSLRTTCGYHDHCVVDGGKARIILSVLVTPASIMDNTPMLDMVH